MLPSACSGCPLASQAGRFLPLSIREGAPVLVVTDTPEVDQEQRFEKLTGMPEGSVNVTAAIRCTAELPELPKGVPQRQDKAGAAEEALLHCRKAHFRVPDGTRLVVARGEYALWSVAGLRSSSSWRGWVVPRRGLGNGWRAEVWTPTFDDAPVLVTAPTADPLAQRLDWKKVKRVLERSWPVPSPGYLVEPDAQMFISPGAWDSEWNPETGEFLRFSVANRNGRTYVIEWEGEETVSAMRRAYGDYVKAMSGMLRRRSQEAKDGNLPSRSREPISRSLQAVLSQAGIAKESAGKEQSKNAAKTVRVIRGAILRHGGEVGWQMPSVQESVWQWTGSETGAGPLSYNGNAKGPSLLKVQPGVGVIGRQPGDDLGSVVVPPIVVVGQNIAVDLENLARVLPSGISIEVHDEMLAHSVLWSDLEHSLDYLSSIYSPINRHKHLMDSSPVEYAAMDAFVQLKVWQALEGELRSDEASLIDYEESMVPLIGIITEAEREGLRLRQDRVQEALAFHGAKQQAVQSEAEAFCGWPINLGSSEQVQRWLYQVEGIGMKPKRGKKRVDRV